MWDQEKVGTGVKKMVRYGYGTHRRRCATEKSGDERNPYAGDVISYMDQVSRFTPTLYWLLKDLVQVSMYLACGVSVCCVPVQARRSR